MYTVKVYYVYIYMYWVMYDEGKINNQIFEA